MRLTQCQIAPDIEETTMVHKGWKAAAAMALAVVIAGCSASARNGGGNQSATAPYSQRGGDRPGIGQVVNPAQQPDSTFAIDIDTASYYFARRQILDGSKPDPSTVRPEEFVNAFRQDYPQPEGNGFTVNVDGARLPRTHRVPDGAGEERLLRIGLQTRADTPADRPDAALTFVIDVSGSMGETGKLDLVQDALDYLIDQLRPTDSVAIVAFNDDAKVLREMTPVRNKGNLHSAVAQLRAGGSTNLEAGLVTGYRVARDGYISGASNRVILLSDGLANVGDTTADPILRQVREEAAKQIALLGVGVGSDYGDALMERLADAGDGFVTYVSEQSQARQLFVTRLPATLTVRALDAKVQVTFDPSVVVNYRLIGYEDRALPPSAFDNNRVDGGEVGPGHSVTALYVVSVRSGVRGQVAEARIRWLDPQGRDAHEQAAAISMTDLGGEFPDASPRLRVDYAAAYLAELLRRSQYGNEVRRADLESIVRDAFADTDDVQVDELATLIDRA
jgi:Ca-activated chloride channel family protein